MENPIQRKAKLILAGLAAMPVVAASAADAQQIQPSAYCSNYSDCQDNSNAELRVTTGLTTEQLEEGRQLVRELNQLDVVTAKEINLTKAPRIPYFYNMPNPAEVDAARTKNLERLTKLRNMIEAAK